MTTRQRILILGGGFGGVYAALELEKMLARRDDLDVTLVTRDNFFLFTPMLHEVAACDLDDSTIINPLRKLLRRVDTFVGTVERIDLAARCVTVAHGDGHTHALPYDHLVLALGCSTNFFGLPGVEQSALTIKSLSDAVALRNRLISRLEEASSECAAGAREPLLTFVVAGGGFAGVETMGGINDFAREAVRYYPDLHEDHLRMVLVTPDQLILPELGPKLGAYAQGKLAARGVEIVTGARVRAMTGEVIELTDGRTFSGSTLVWAAGALVPDGSTGGFHPPTAQHALREGRVLARNVVATIDGRAPRPFRFKTLGQLAAIGRRTGVAHVFGINFSGFVAWWLWRTIYLSKLPRFEKKVRVALDWTLDLCFTKDFACVTALSPLRAVDPGVEARAS